MTMEESIGDIHLVNGPAARHGEMEHGANGHGLDNRSERVSEVDTGTLMKATNDPTRLMSVEGAIRMELVLKDPLPSDDVGVAGSWNKLPCLVVMLQCVELVLHGREPHQR
jgi:hypothetical protein